MCVTMVLWQIEFWFGGTGVESAYASEYSCISDKILAILEYTLKELKNSVCIICSAYDAKQYSHINLFTLFDGSFVVMIAK